MAAPVVKLIGPEGLREVRVLARDVDGLAQAATNIAKVAFSGGAHAAWFDLDTPSKTGFSRRIILRPGRPPLGVSVPTKESACVGDRVFLPGGSFIAIVTGLTYETYGSLTAAVTLVESVLDGRVRENSIPGVVRALPSAIDARIVREDGQVWVVDVTQWVLESDGSGVVDRIPGQAGRGLEGMIPQLAGCVEVEVAASMAAYFGLLPEPTKEGLTCPPIPAQRLESSRRLWLEPRAETPALG